MSGRPIIETTESAASTGLAESSADPVGAKSSLVEAFAKRATTRPLQGWSIHARWIPTKSPHGQQYVNVSYQAHPRLRMGLDWRPLTNDVTPLINALIIPEGKSWYEPALIAGLSNDDFGTTNSYATYATLSKHLTNIKGVDISTYAGAAHIFQLDETNPVGGAVLRYRSTSMHWQYSGTQWHGTISQRWRNHTFSFVMFDLRQPGMGYSYRF